MKSRWRDLSPIECSCICNYSLITCNKTPVPSTWVLLRVCAACPTPRLNLSSELHPSWEQHPRYVPRRVHAGYNSFPYKGNEFVFDFSAASLRHFYYFKIISLAKIFFSYFQLNDPDLENCIVNQLFKLIEFI